MCAKYYALRRAIILQRDACHSRYTHQIPHTQQSTTLPARQHTIPSKTTHHSQQNNTHLPAKQHATLSKTTRHSLQNSTSLLARHTTLSKKQQNISLPPLRHTTRNTTTHHTQHHYTPHTPPLHTTPKTAAAGLLPNPRSFSDQLTLSALWLTWPPDLLAASSIGSHYRVMPGRSLADLAA